MTEPRTNLSDKKDKSDFEEVQIPVPWGHIAGKWWGSKDVQPIICLHGWQDNAGTFDSLAMALSSRMAFLALDLSGHGNSSHLPPGIYYYVFWEGLVNLRKWWGSRSMQPIIALHGRQDNAGSFDALIPSLSNSISFLCLDLPGHGFSSHLPKGQFYHAYWDGVQMIRRVVKYFMWTKIKILGHSMGGAIGFLYAASYPNEVDALVCLDIASPSVRDLSTTVTTTGDVIDRFLKFEDLTLDNVPCYTYDKMIDIVEEAYSGALTNESAKILMRRGMQPSSTPGHYFFSRDPRLKTSVLGLLSLDLVLSYAAQIKCRYLNVRARPGLRFEFGIEDHYEKVLDVIRESAKSFEYQEVQGSHHVHLNEPEKFVSILENFFQV